MTNKAPKAVVDRAEARILNRLEDMPAIIALMDDFGAKQAIPPMIVNDFHVALDEVINNVISYGYPLGEPGEITVRLSYDQAILQAEIQDDGVAFDPLSTGTPNLTTPLGERKVGGVGIQFVRNLMDTVAYYRDGHFNRLRLTKSVPKI